ncbi:hypothetical protein HYH02_014271 [Chlamydomonas schloesseri]|uniref:Uncharacterized protein n=1 Tax=Chlamydomonas schloesseri TaxID=2026947 RepID=A0A835VUY5_9CHLO|nr:hypothetical protein HYH02_014271 [Chlamydomonas schloesseri]|eukprot:KAG2428860.1 hypothetical protein HYH02_014271 [Chlamydomonas schloesseri]
MWCWIQRHAREGGGGGACSSCTWVPGYVATPAGSASSSLAAASKFRLAADGTLNWGGGVATGQSVALNPSQGRWASQLLGGPGGQSRPASATAAYVVVPQFLQCCSLFPSRGYFLSEAATGASGASAAGGYYWVGELGYNPLSNRQAQAGTFDGPHTGPLAARAVVSRGDQSLGFAGVEAIGQTNAVVNFADPRVEQYGQVLAYPFNLLSPWDPLTCTQVLVSGTASTGLNLNQLLTQNQKQPGTSAGNASSSSASSSDTGVRGLVLPSTKILDQASGTSSGNSSAGNNSSTGNSGAGNAGSRSQAPVGLVPFCAQWFNLQTLDALRSFQAAAGPAFHSDYLDNGDYGGGNGDDYGDSSGGLGAGAGDSPAGTDSSGGDSGGASSAGGAGTLPGSSVTGGQGPGTGSRVSAGKGSTNGDTAAGAGGYRGTAGAIPHRPPGRPAPAPANGTEGPRVLFVGDASVDDSAAAGSASLQQAHRGGSGQQAAAAPAASSPVLDRLMAGAAASPAAQLLPPVLKQLILGGTTAQSAVPGVGPLAGAFRSAAANATARQRAVLNTSLSHMNEAWQLRVQAAALRAEAVVRAVVAIADAASPLTAEVLQVGKAGYSRAAALSNDGVDAAIAVLSAGLPPGVAEELRARAAATAAQLAAEATANGGMAAAGQLSSAVGGSGPTGARGPLAASGR